MVNDGDAVAHGAAVRRLSRSAHDDDISSYFLRSSNRRIWPVGIGVDMASLARSAATHSSSSQ